MAEKTQSQTPGQPDMGAFGGLLNAVMLIAKGTTTNQAAQNAATVAGTAAPGGVPMSPVEGIMHLVNVLQNGQQPGAAPAGGIDQSKIPQQEAASGGKKKGSTVDGILKVLSAFGG